MLDPRNVFNDWGTVDAMLKRAKAEFLVAESDLLRLSAHEASVTAKFACYLQFEVNGLVADVKVDCEYTRIGNIPNRPPKRIAIPAGRLREQERRPDIIIHGRGNPHANFVAIEAKWDGEDLRRARETLAFLASDAQMERAREHAEFAAFAPYQHAVLMTIRRDPADFDFERLDEDDIERIIREARD